MWVPSIAKHGGCTPQNAMWGRSNTARCPQSNLLGDEVLKMLGPSKREMGTQQQLSYKNMQVQNQNVFLKHNSRVASA